MYILYRGLNKVFIVHLLQTNIILSPVISYTYVTVMLKVRISIGFSSMVNGGDSFSTGFPGLPAATTIKVNTLLFCGFNFRGTRPIREKQEILHCAKIPAIRYLLLQSEYERLERVMAY